MQAAKPAVSAAVSKLELLLSHDEMETYGSVALTLASTLSAPCSQRTAWPALQWSPFSHTMGPIVLSALETASVRTRNSGVAIASAHLHGSHMSHL